MSSISAGTAAGAALVQTGDTTGQLVIKTGSSAATAATFNADQTTTFAGAVSAPSFSGTSSTATNLAGGSNGTIPYQSAAGTTQMLAVGTPGQLLQTNGAGAPTWTTVAAPNTAGGATVTNPMSANITLTSSSNRVQLMTPSAWGYTITLPDATTMGAAGGPIFILKNTTKYYPIKVLDSAGTNIAWVVSDYDTEIFLTSTASATGNWVIETHNPTANGGIYTYDSDVNLIINQIAGAFTQGVGLSPTAGMMSTGAPAGANTRYYSTVSLQETFTRYRGQTTTSSSGQAANLGTTFLLRMTDTSVVFLYNNGAGVLFGRVCTVSANGDIVANGTEVGISYFLYGTISAVRLTSSTALVTWVDTNFVTSSCVISISGTTLSFGTETATVGDASQINPSTIALQTPTLATVVSQLNFTITACSISGSAITFPATITLSSCQAIYGVFAASATTTVVVYYNNSFNLNAVVVTNNGTTLTVGTPVTLLTVNGSLAQNFAISELNIGLGLIVPTYSRGQNVEQPYFIVAVSGGVPYIKSQGVLPKSSDLYTYVYPNSGACLIPTISGATSAASNTAYAYNAKKAVIVGAA